MPARSWVRQATVFVVVVVLTIAVVSASTIAPTFDQGADGPEERPEYDTAKLVPDRPPAEGQITTERGDAGVVLIDQAHSNRVNKEDLQPFEAALSQRGYTVEYLETKANFDEQLARADAFVVLDPGISYTDQEANRVESFVDSGGRLLMAGEPSQLGIQQVGFFAILVPLPARIGPLSSRFGIQFSEGHLFNMESNDGNHLNIFARGTGTALAEGVDRTAMYTAAAVDAQEGTPVLVATEGTRNARGDVTGEYALAVRSGNVLAVGDRTFFERGNFRVADNARFLENVIVFLTTGDRKRTLLEYPAIVGTPPDIRYTEPDLLDAAQAIGGSLREARSTNPSVLLESDTVTTRDAEVLVTTFDYLDTHPGIGTEIDVSGDTMSVPGYESSPDNVAVIHYTDDETVVVAADTPEHAEAAADLLVNQQFEPNAISDRTVIIRFTPAETP